jgi:hypothetical protein
VEASKEEEPWKTKNAAKYLARKGHRAFAINVMIMMMMMMMKKMIMYSC